MYEYILQPSVMRRASVELKNGALFGKISLNKLYQYLIFVPLTKGRTYIEGDWVNGSKENSCI
jgi:hypothetical protein